MKMKYKSKRIIDGKPKWVIVDENEKIVSRNPNKEELKGLEIFETDRYRRTYKYNPTNTCDICGINFDDAPYYGHPHREYDKERKWIGRWICQNCYQKEEYKKGKTTLNLIVEMGDRRSGNLDPNCTSARADRFEDLTCKWRSTVSIIPIENLNIKNDNYCSPIDHSRDSELGILQTKYSFYNSIESRWDFCTINEFGKIFDNLIAYCVSKDGKIERIYIFPKDEIIKRTIITIYKNSIRSWVWTEKYRVKDENILKKVNEIWSKL